MCRLHEADYARSTFVRQNVVGGCGKGRPIFVLRLDYGAGKKVNMMIEKLF